jgi:hypothetical protein
MVDMIPYLLYKVNNVLTYSNSRLYPTVRCRERGSGDMLDIR